MSGGGKSGGGGGGAEIPANTTTTTKWTPPDFLGGANGGLNSYMSYASQVLGKPYQQYQGQQIAGQATDQQMGQDIIRARALNGSGMYTAPSDNNYLNTMNGAYMSQANPYLNNVIDQSNADIAKAYSKGTAAQTDSSFARSGAFGGSAYNEQKSQNQQDLTDRLANNTNSLRYGNYQTERNNQMALQGYGDIAANRDYQDANALMQSGGGQQQYLQRLLNQGQQDFNGATNFLYDTLGRFGNTMNPLLGLGGSSSTASNSGTQGQGGSNGLANVLGAGMTGYGLYRNLAGLGALGGAAGGAGLAGGITGIASGAFGDPFSSFLI